MSGLTIRRIALALGASATLAASAPASRTFADDNGASRRVIRWQNRQASVRIEPIVAKARVSAAPASARRSYRFHSEAGAERDVRLVTETKGEPYIRSGNALFDGLFALALADVRLDRVSKIRDAAFNEGRPIDCVCFETGEKWPYVWTRDISYSLDLGLASIDPMRAFNSLLFKASGMRADLAGGRLAPATVVAQDTGSGGSWPVSTDRVVWVMAASDVLGYLPATHRATAVRRVYAIARDTLDQERRYTFDRYMGLYRGETSFLDWREQNYPAWTRNDVAFIAAGYALSTNVLHAVALERTAQLAKAVGDPEAARYLQWAAELRSVINARFWQAQSGSYASYLSAAPNSVASNSYDLLGLSLAITHGIADDVRAQSILQRYPVSAAGPPVVWPEQAGIAIYHNRAIWPFVTAYALRAAKSARHAELAGELAESLMRGAALSLSNMENFEFLTQRTRFEDGAMSGPVINSPRQLWSVAGYLSMVLDTVWGLELQDGQLSINPWLPGRLADSLFGGRRALSLHDFRVDGKRLNVTLELPRPLPSTGWLERGSATLNGKRLDGSLNLSRLRPGLANELRVTMRVVAGKAQPIARIPAAPRAVFAPSAPIDLAATREGDAVTLTWRRVEPGASVQIYANGRQLTADAAGERFVDRSVSGQGTVCYSLTQRFSDTGLASLSSREACIPDPGKITRSAAAGGGLVPNDGVAARVIDGVARYADWGSPSQELSAAFTPRTSGWYRLTLKYANFNGPINTGITAAVKTATALCGGTAEQSGSVAMPHSGEAHSWGFSTAFLFKASSGDACELRIEDGFNMSYLAHFATYTGGRGGAAGALNRADIAAAQIEFIRNEDP